MDIVTKKIFEGYENHEFFATDGISMLQTVQAANVLLDSDRIVELMPISSFRNFLDLSMPIGLCR